jgi:hypothetical protein
MKYDIKHDTLNMKTKLTVLFALLIGFSSIGQVTFNTDKEKFIKEVSKFMSGTNGKKTKEFMSVFTPVFMSSEYDETLKSELITTCNTLVAKRLKAYPDMYNYMSAHMNFIIKKHDAASFDEWKKSLAGYLEIRNVKKAKDFLQVSSDLMVDGNIYTKNQKFVWGQRNGKFSFKSGKKPSIKFEGVTLYCKIKKRTVKRKEDPYFDSLVVLNTNGVYDPVLNKWNGTDGRVTWEKVGLKAEETFADLTSYNLSMKTTKLTCGTVTFHTPYFDEPLQGKLTEYTAKMQRETDKVYPSFDSNDKKLKIKGIVSNVDYVGGFAMRGAKFVGMGTPEQKANLTFYRNEKTFAKCTGELFIVSKDHIKASNTSLVMNISNEDSITHPGGYLTYITAEEKFEFARGNDGVSQSPFSNSYHQLDMFVGQIIWEKSKSDLTLTWNRGKSQEQRFAMFESKSFYSAKVYGELQGMDAEHPLVSIYNYAYKYDEFETTEGKIATAMHKTIQQAKPTLLQLSNLGFITYDYNAKTVKILDKTKNFIRARAKKIDYDNLVFKSDVRPISLSEEEKALVKKNPVLAKRQARFKKQNKARAKLAAYGTLSLSTLELNLDAVDIVELSPLQNTRVFPENDHVTIKKNRNFDFKGWLAAGKSEVLVKDGVFDYDEFKIHLKKTETVGLRVYPLDKSHGKDPKRMITEISNFSGFLEIDHPKNKSGVKDKGEFKAYPKLITTKESKIFYNSNGIYGGVYDSARFYVTLEPFTLDSLDDFTERLLSLNGELTSAGIFPNFKKPVKIMDDYSFGFFHTIPSGGYDFYGKVAKYDNKIALSGNGLQGEGEIKFETSLSKSNRFTFFPDSTMGVANYVNTIREAGIQMPSVKCEKALVTYVPHSKLLKAKSLDEPLDFFDGESVFNGTTYLRPEGMTGRGLMAFHGSKMGSYNFKYKARIIDADTCSFKLDDEDPEPGTDPFAFATENINGHVDFDKREGEFKSNDGESTVHFPANKYMCKMDMFTWYMDQGEIELAKNEGTDVNIETDLDLAGSNFYSTHPKQDSLNFKAPKAKFTIKTKVITCSKTQFIDVADARIFPDSMKVVIRRNAKMDELINSTIVANYITKYHKVINAKTKITARKAYKASGDYPYYDIDSNQYLIYFKDIRLDEGFQTIAEGKIKEDRKFKFSPQFDFYGDVAMKSSDPFLTFTGATRISHECASLAKNWMSFSAQINPKDIMIPVGSSMKNLDGKPLSAGIVLRDSEEEDSVDVYPTFLSSLDSDKDQIIVTASGFLRYDFDASEFQIASKEKFVNRNAPGNYISLHTKSCSMQGDGEVNLGGYYGDLSFKPVGIVNYNQATGAVEMNLSGKMDFALDKGAWSKVAEKMVLETEGQAINMDQTTLEQSIATNVDQKTADKIKSDYTLKGEVKKIPKGMNSTIYLTNVKLKWDKETSSFVSSSNKIGIVSLYGKSVFKELTGKMQFQKSPSTEGKYMDRIKMLFETPTSYYFFDYNFKTKKKTDNGDGTMKLYSTDGAFKQEILDIKTEKKKVKQFEYDITPNSSGAAIFRSDSDD